jgi:phage gp29-like protein
MRLFADPPNRAAVVPQERIRTAPAGQRFRFLPFWDNLTDESWEMQQAYSLMLKEPAVKVGLLSKVLAVASLDLQVHPPDKDSPRDRMIAEYHTYNLKRCRGGVPEIATAILFGGLITGYSVCEKVRKPEPETRGKWAGKLCLSAIKAKRDVRLQLDQYNNVTGLRSLRYGDNTVWDPKDFLIWRHLSIWDSPHGMSDFRAAYRAFVIKDTAVKLRAIYLDKYNAGPFLVGKYKKVDQQAALQAALETARANNWVTLPADVEIEAMNLAFSTADVFKTTCDDLDREMVLSLTGAYLQALEGTVTDGAGNSQVHSSTSDLFKWYLSYSVAQVISSEVLSEYTDLNFLDADYPSATLSAIDPAELKAAADLDAVLVGKVGLKLSKKEAYERYSRSEPADEADTLTGPPQPGGGPGGGPPPAAGSDQPFADPPNSPAREVPAAQPFRQPTVTSWGYQLGSRQAGPDG